MTTGALRNEVIGAELSNTQHGSWNEREALEAPVAECCCLGKVDLSGYRDSLKIGFTCWVTRIKVVLRLNSFSLAAPTYVHVDRMPPRMSRIVCSTSPLKGTSTVFPSEALGKEILYYLFVQNFLSPVTLSLTFITLYHFSPKNGTLNFPGGMTRSSIAMFTNTHASLPYIPVLSHTS